MIDFLSHIGIASLLCIGIRVATDTNMIFEKPATWICKYIPRFFHKPLFDCPPCQASVWGSGYYLFTFGLEWRMLLFVFCVCGLNAVLVKYF